MKLRHVLIVSGALVVASLFAGIGLPLLANAVGTADTPQARTVTVNGTASVSSVPDTATLSLGVTTQGKTAAAAFSANSTDVAKVIAALKAAGVASKDIQTQYVSLSPRTNNTGEQVLGYTAFNSVNVTTQDLKRAGAIIDAAVGAGADTVNGPSLTRSDSDAQYRQALKAAFADAQKKAAALAEAGHFAVGTVQNVTENTASPPTPMFGAADKVSTTQASIEPGTQQVDANVTVTFAIS
jgi:uncharacterized protein YggE